MSINERIGNTKFMAAVVLAAVFLVGAASGAGVWHLVMTSMRSGPPPMHGPIPLHLLELSAAQEEKVHDIFEAHRPELEKVLSSTFPKVRAINTAIETEVNELLTEKQRKRFEAIRSKRPDGPPHGMPHHGSHKPPPPMFRPTDAPPLGPPHMHGPMPDMPPFKRPALHEEPQPAEPQQPNGEKEDHDRRE